MSLNKLRANNVKIVHVITKQYKGGAQELVNTLVDSFVTEGVSACSVSFVNPIGKQLGANRVCLDVQNRKSPAIVLKLRRYIKNICLEHPGPVILHTHLLEPLYYTVPASFDSDVQLVHTVHNTWNRRRAWRAFRVIDSSIYAFYNRIVTISSAAMEKLREWLVFDVGKQIATIRNGIEIWSTYELNSVPHNKRLSLVSVGKMSDQKGFGLAIKAISNIKYRVENYTIVGDGERQEELKKLACRKGVQNIVEFVGWQSDVEPFLEKADIQLIPSRWEGFGLVAVEGMAKGLPIVASDVPGLRDVLGKDNDFNILLGERDPAMWADAITEMKKRMIENGPRLSVNARGRSKKFSKNKMVRRYAKLYADTVEV